MQPDTFAVGDRAVALIIRDNSIVLIHRQKPDHEYYVLPGGSIEADETPVDACLREVAEETGIHATATTYLCTLSNQGRTEHYFLVEAHQDPLQLGGPERERYTTDNRYMPVWVAKAKLLTLNLQPPDIRHLILMQL